MSAQHDELLLFFEHAPVGAAVLDGDACMGATNAALQQLLGYTAQELRGRMVADLTHPGDLAAELALFEELRAGERSEYRLRKRFLRSDGDVVWTREFVHRSDDASGAPHIVVFVEDERGQRRSEERLRSVALERDAIAHELQKTKAALALALGAGGMGLWEWDVEQGVVRWSRELSALLGQPVLQEVPFGEQRELLHPDDWGPLFERMQRGAAGRDDLRDLRFQLRHAEGRYCEMIGRGLVERDADGRARRIVVVAWELGAREGLEGGEESTPRAF